MATNGKIDDHGVNKSSEERQLLMVYGTLKKGQPNGFEMTDLKTGRADFVGRVRSIQSFPMVIASKYNIPCLLPKEGTGHVSDTSCMTLK